MNPFARVGLFVRQTAAETRKAAAPSGRALARRSAAAGLLVLTLMAAVTILDLAFGRGTLAVFG